MPPLSRGKPFTSALRTRGPADPDRGRCVPTLPGFVFRRRSEGGSRREWEAAFKTHETHPNQTMSRMWPDKAAVRPQRSLHRVQFIRAAFAPPARSLHRLQLLDVRQRVRPAPMRAESTRKEESLTLDVSGFFVALRFARGWTIPHVGFRRFIPASNISALHSLPSSENGLTSIFRAPRLGSNSASS